MESDRSQFQWTRVTVNCLGNNARIESRDGLDIQENRSCNGKMSGTLRFSPSVFSRGNATSSPTSVRVSCVDLIGSSIERRFRALVQRGHSDSQREETFYDERDYSVSRTRKKQLVIPVAAGRCQILRRSLTAPAIRGVG
jgi:hypothetical protein